MRHHIFLSYSRQNTDIMERLRDDFRSAGLSVWTDEGIDPGSASWKIEIEEAIRDASYIVVIFSPSATSSRWVRAELDYAEAQKKPIYAVLAEGDESNAVPFGYSSHQWIDLRDAKHYDSNFQRLLAALSSRSKEPVTPSSSTTSAKTDPPTPSAQRNLPNFRWWIPVILAMAAVIYIRFPFSINTSNETTPTPVTQSGQQHSANINRTAVPIATYVPASQWATHEKPLFSISAPLNWMNTNPDSEVFVALAQNIIQGYDPEQGIPQLPNSEIYLYLGDFLNLQGLFVLRETLNLDLTLSVMNLRYQDFIQSLGYSIHSIENVILPSGESIRIVVDNSTGEVQGIGHIYIVMHENQSFLFLFAAAGDVDEQRFAETNEQIISTLRFTE